MRLHAAVLVRSLSSALRSLRRSLAFTVAVVLTLALGIGANAAIVSIVNTVLLKPTPHVQDPGSLGWIYTSDYSGPPFGSSSYPDYVDYRERTPALRDALITSPGAVSYATAEGEARVLIGEFVSGNYFGVLGVAPALGRGFADEEDDPRSGAAVAVLGHAFWARELGSDPTVVGRTLPLSGNPVTVVGIAPEGFRGSIPIVHTDMWVPTSTQALLEGADPTQSRGSRGAFIRARLTDGATLAQAQSQLDVLAAQLHAAYPEEWTDMRDSGRRITIVSDREARVPPQARGAVVGFVALLLFAVAGVLLIACANVANLMLARAERRSREVAVRSALGASRTQLVLQLFAESGILAVLGGALGVLSSHILLRSFRTLSLPFPITPTLDFGIDRTALLVCTAITAGTALVIGSLPALRGSRPDLVRSLKAGEAGGTGRRRLFGIKNLLVVTQVAGSLVLLVGAGLFAKALRSATQVDPGLDSSGVAMASLSLDVQGYDEAEGQILLDRLLARLRSLPGVEAAATTEVVPLTAGGQRSSVAVPGYEPAVGEDMEFDYATVSTGFFETLRIELVSGRTFDDTDGPDAFPVLVVNEAFAARFWPGENPVGKPVRFGRIGDAEVVGVVRDGKYRALDEEQRLAFWAPARQVYAGTVQLLVKTSGADPADLVGVIRREVRALDPRLPLGNPGTVADAMGITLLPQRIASMTLGLTGALAMLLASLGLYGVLAYSVSRRTREVGVRMALGARAGDVIRMIVVEGVGVAGVGAALGLLAALGLSRLIQGFLFGVSPVDPGVLLGVVALLLAVAAMASYLPARDLAALEPARTLRQE